MKPERPHHTRGMGWHGTGCVTLLAGLLVLIGAQLLAAEVPPLEGRVNDLADMIDSATEHQLEAVLAQLENAESTQILILTIATLQGETIENFALQVAERWQPGQKGIDNGVLLVVAKKERRIRIEVGYGLEGQLTDLIAGRIIRDIMVPQFKAGRFDQGMIQGVAAIVEVVRGQFKSDGSHGSKPRHKDSQTGALGLIALLLFTNLVGRVNRLTGSLAGGILAPIAGFLFFNAGLITILGLIPLGMAAGFLVSFMGRPLSFGHATGYNRRSSIHWTGGFRSSGGFGSGGFSGGGGGFGGGGASGGW